MKTIFYGLLILALCAAGYGYQYVQTHPALRYYGMGDSDTPPFQINDGWELSWVSAGALKVELVPRDGGSPVEVKQTSGMARGLTVRDKGGLYSLRIHGAMPWLVTAMNKEGTEAVASVPPASEAVAPVAPVVAPDAAPAVAPVMVASVVPSGASSPPLVPGSAGVPTSSSSSAARAASSTEGMSREAMKAVVLIKGDRAEGTGFLIKMADGPAVVTNLHVLAANPNFKMTTSSGAVIEARAMKGAADRDLALISIKDAGYSYLELAPDVAGTVQPGDDVVTPGNSQGGEVLLPTIGTIMGIGPDRVEFSNPIFHGNSGGPIYHKKSGKVVGVVTEAMKVDTSDALDKASSLSLNSAITGPMRYFGMRLDNVPTWLPVDWQRFLTETEFLIQFQEKSRELDSYLNGDEDHPEGIDPSLYKKNEQLVRANDEVMKMASGGDAAQRLDAVRQFVFDMELVADTDIKSIDNQNNFYSFNWEQAKREKNYRLALRKEIEAIAEDVSRVNGLAHRN